LACIHCPELHWNSMAVHPISIIYKYPDRLKYQNKHWFLIC
jgi:hypothetical protein